jgi:hypothetical protein
LLYRPYAQDSIDMHDMPPCAYLAKRAFRWFSGINKRIPKVRKRLAKSSVSQAAI